MTNCRLRWSWWWWWQRYCNPPLPPIDSESGGNDDDGERSCCCCWEWVVEISRNIPETRSVENSSFSFIALVRMWSIQKELYERKRPQVENHHAKREGMKRPIGRDQARLLRTDTHTHRQIKFSPRPPLGPHPSGTYRSPAVRDKNFPPDPLWTSHLGDLSVPVVRDKFYVQWEILTVTVRETWKECVCVSLGEGIMNEWTVLPKNADVIITT